MIQKPELVPQPPSDAQQQQQQEEAQQQPVPPPSGWAPKQLVTAGLLSPMVTTVEDSVFVPSGGCGCSCGGRKHKCECDDGPPNPDVRDSVEKENVSSDDDDDDDDGDEFDKEFSIYSLQVHESGGFHVDKRRPGTTLLGGITSLEIEDKDLFEKIRNLTEMAIKQQNANLEFVDLMKANAQRVRGIKYYITFVAKDSSGETGNYQTLVWDGIWEKVVQIFRPEPIKQGASKKSRLNVPHGV